MLMKVSHIYDILLNLNMLYLCCLFYVQLQLRVNLARHIQCYIYNSVLNIKYDLLLSLRVMVWANALGFFRLDPFGHL